MCSFVSLEIQYNYFLAFRLEKLGSNSIGKSPTGRGGELVLFFLPPQIELDWLKPLSIHIHTDGKQERKGGLNRKEEIIPTLGWCSSNVGKKKGREEEEEEEESLIRCDPLQCAADGSFFLLHVYSKPHSLHFLIDERRREADSSENGADYIRFFSQTREGILPSHPVQVIDRWSTSPRI